MWTCPECKHRFAARNQAHSCGAFSVESHLEGASPEVVATYDRLVAEVKKLGDFTIHPVKTRIGFCNRMTFCAVWVRQTHLGGHLVLDEPPASARFTRGELPIVHRFRLGRAAEIDDEFRRCLEAAWRRGLAKAR